MCQFAETHIISWPNSKSLPSRWAFDSIAAPQSPQYVRHNLLEMGGRRDYTVLDNELFLVRGYIMAESRIEIDFELARMLMLKQKELYNSKTLSLPAHFNFEGYTPESISYNIKKLVNASLITAQVSTEWHRGKLKMWPTGITEHGWKFLEAAKDETRWAEAVETVKQQGDAATFGPLKVVLFAGVRRVDVVESE